MQLEKHAQSFPRASTSFSPLDATAELESLGSIVLLLRKLREGVVASGRVDDFALNGRSVGPCGGLKSVSLYHWA